MQEESSQIEKLIKENIKISEENSFLLKRIEKTQKRIFFVKVLYFIFAVGFLFGAFYYVAPILKRIIGLYENLPHTVPDFFDYAPFLKDLKEIIPEHN